MELVLGSQSPRREEILRFFSIPFIKASPDFDERSVPFTGDPQDYVQTLAKKKAECLQPKFPAYPILTADTIVFFQGLLFNKPNSREEAFSFLKQLAGKQHSVFTALGISYQGTRKVLVEETKITFHEASDQQLNQYLDHLNFLDKAGGYAIQQSGSLLVKKIEGCYYNVMGLPLTSLKELLSEIGIDLWSHLKLL